MHTSPQKYKKDGFTLVELLISVGIFSLLALGIAWLLINSLRSSEVVWDQLSTQNDARRVLQEVVDSIRRAEQSDIGSYPIEAASSTGIIFYANIDTDTNRERVRIWLDGTTVKRGIIHPGGDPLLYDEANEQIVEIAHATINTQQGNPLFTYYDTDYTGEEAPLADPPTIPSIRVVRIQLELEKNLGESPVPFHAESVVHIRNLKEN
jgi:prepilin-type N-terminal cleavage/methylation domain-containing protein